MSLNSQTQMKWSSHYGLRTDIKPLSKQTLVYPLDGSSPKIQIKQEKEEAYEQFHIDKYGMYRSDITPLTIGKIKQEQSRFTQPQGMIEGFSLSSGDGFVGCFKDTKVRAMEMGSKNTRDEITIDSCRQLAKERGKNVFGMQYPQGKDGDPSTGVCFIGDAGFDKYGSVPCSDRKDEKGRVMGDGWINAVYQTEPSDFNFTDKYVQIKKGMKVEGDGEISGGLLVKGSLKVDGKIADVPRIISGTIRGEDADNQIILQGDDFTIKSKYGGIGEE
jgi:hypothetical protein